MTEELQVPRKVCRSCGSIKPLEDFYKRPNAKDGRVGRCVPCLKQYVKDWARDNPERVKAQRMRKCPVRAKERASAWYQANRDRALKNMAELRRTKPDYVRDGKLKASFGISLVEYNELLQKQNSCCAICGKNQGEFTRRLAVDHCHATGRVRGLLCGRCNTAIGHFKESIQTLTQAITYLQTK